MTAMAAYGAHPGRPVGRPGERACRQEGGTVAVANAAPCDPVHATAIWAALGLPGCTRSFNTRAVLCHAPCDRPLLPLPKQPCGRCLKPIQQPGPSPAGTRNPMPKLCVATARGSGPAPRQLRGTRVTRAPSVAIDRAQSLQCAAAVLGQLCALASSHASRAAGPTSRAGAAWRANCGRRRCAG